MENLIAIKKIPVQKDTKTKNLHGPKSMKESWAKKCIFCTIPLYLDKNV